MARTTIRWLLLAAVSCAMIWFGILFRPPERERFTPPDDDILGGWYYKSTPARAIEGRLAQANERLRLLELRDSIVRAVAAKPATPLTLLLDPTLPPATRARLDSQLTRQWNALKVPPGHSVAVAVLLDTARKAHGFPRARRYAGGLPIDIFLPSAMTAG